MPEALPLVFELREGPQLLLDLLQTMLDELLDLSGRRRGACHPILRVICRAPMLALLQADAMLDLALAKGLRRVRQARSLTRHRKIVPLGPGNVIA